MQKLILGLSMIVFITSCTLGLTDNDENNITQKSKSGITNYSQDINKMSGKIRNTEEFESCMKQQSHMCMQTVGMQIAQKTKDAEFCKELSNSDQQSSCEFAVTMVNAQEKNDEKICDTLINPKYKEVCKIQIYRQNAIAKNDVTLCDKINLLISSGSKTDTKNHDIVTQKDQCIMQFVMNNPNSKIMDCQGILDESSFEMCQKNIKNKTNTTEKSTSK